MVGACVVDQPAARLTKPRTTDAQWSFFHRNPNFLAWADNLGRYILGHLGYFRSIYQHPFWYLSMFSINQPFFLQKTKLLYPNTKYLFGIRIWIWAANNQGFSHRVSVVRVLLHSWYFYVSMMQYSSKQPTYQSSDILRRPRKFEKIFHFFEVA